MQKLHFACALMFLITLAALPVCGAGRSQTVLVVYSNEQALPANRQIDDQLRETLEVETDLDTAYQTEYLDYPRYADESDEAYDKLVSDFLREKYAGGTIDVVVAVGPQAFRFLRRHQDDLFVGTPVLVIAITRSSYEDHTLPNRYLG